MKSIRYPCQILMKLEFFLNVLEKKSNIKFHENPFSGNRIVSCGRTDGRTDTDRHTYMPKLTVAFRNFANEPNKNRPSTVRTCQIRKLMTYAK
jgi:hypothetical protein